MSKKLLSLFLIGAMSATLIGCGGGETTTESSAPVEETSQVEESAEPDVPKEYQNALKKAEGYAEMNMSKQGIYEQLTSEYGEQFPEDAAQYAIDNLEWDFNKNALETAKSYQDDMAMSSAEIYDQLVSEYGEQFTPEEAQYAVDNLPQ